MEISSPDDVRHRLKNALRSAADLLFPPCCALCGADRETSQGPHVCCACLRAVERCDGPVCRRCGTPDRAALCDVTSCPACCRRHYHFSEAIAWGVYRGELQQVVLRMKRAFEEPLMMTMGQYLGRLVRLRRADWQPDLVVPIPMHWTRRLLRGVNTAEVLAESVAGLSGGAVARDVLTCRRKTKKQGTLLPKERFHNVRHALGVSAGYDLTGARILLVDDIMTTGATASEAARLLRQAGAARVFVAVVARAASGS